MLKVKHGDTVTINYTAMFEDGTIFETTKTEGRIPYKIKVGDENIMIGLNDALLEMSVGETKTVIIEPEYGYGMPKEELILDVLRHELPENIEPGSVGSFWSCDHPFPIDCKILEINEKTVKIDFNSPLAGKKLIFDIEILSINPINLVENYGI